MGSGRMGREKNRGSRREKEERGRERGEGRETREVLPQAQLKSRDDI